MARGNFRMVGAQEITIHIKKLELETDAKTATLVDYFGDVAEAHMKTTAPWTDRTGNARNGLGAIGEHLGIGHYALTLFHRMPYGIWLEVKYSGRDAVILPSIRVIGPQLMRALNGLWGRLR
jgi:hypothetical protein